MNHSDADKVPGDEQGEGSDRDGGENSPALRAKVKKAPSAFRTISEVADELHIPQHVLRFWETKFPQVKPLKRGGGRRYYRPDDITLLRRISDLLYIQGYTIKGVQRLLREGGGRLSDNIPPPAAEERETMDIDAAHAEPDFKPQPTPDIAVAAPADAQPRAGLHVGTEPRLAGPAETQRMVPDPETARLRSVLADVLSELEAIRATL